jgi:hypothetical protein
MKRPVLLSLLIIPLFAPPAVAVPQTVDSPQAVSAPTYQRPNWTEDDKKTLLTKAQRGEAGAQFWLGAGYEQGRFGKADFQEALKWLRRAAKHGDADAQNALGQMYEDGEGVPRNYVLAAQWYRKAAEHVPDLGAASQGRNNLGMLYVDGLGVPKDYVQAYMWFSLTNFETNLASAKAQMTPAQILEAKRMAAAWKSRHSGRRGRATPEKFGLPDCRSRGRRYVYTLATASLRGSGQGRAPTTKSYGQSGAWSPGRGVVVPLRFTGEV